jgi:Protein of unknown function (DUF3108)
LRGRRGNGVSRIPFLLLSASLSLAVPWTAPQEGRSGELPVALEVGERFRYSVSFSGLHVGSAEMALVGQDTLRGHPVWRAVLHLTGGFSLFGVDDSTVSWFDTTTFASRRFVQKIREGRYHADRDFTIDPERMVYAKNGQPEVPSVAEPLDDVSFLYFVRTLKLEPGTVLTVNRYFRPEGNPVTIRVIRRERIQVPAGEFAALLIEPEITTAGIFSRNGQALVWLSDDNSRTLLQLKSRLSFGSINLYLNQIISGPKMRPTTPP